MWGRFFSPFWQMWVILAATESLLKCHNVLVVNRVVASELHRIAQADQSQGPGRAGAGPLVQASAACPVRTAPALPLTQMRHTERAQARWGQGWTPSEKIQVWIAPRPFTSMTMSKAWTNPAFRLREEGHVEWLTSPDGAKTGREENNYKRVCSLWPYLQTSIAWTHQEAQAGTWSWFLLPCLMCCSRQRRHSVRFSWICEMREYNIFSVIRVTQLAAKSIISR